MTMTSGVLDQCWTMRVGSLILIRRIGVMARDCCPSAIRSGETTRSAATEAQVEPRTTPRSVGRGVPAGANGIGRHSTLGDATGEMLTSRSRAVTPSDSEQRLGGSDVDAMVMVTTARRGRDARDCSARSRASEAASRCARLDSAVPEQTRWAAALKQPKGTRWRDESTNPAGQVRRTEPTRDPPP